MAGKWIQSATKDSHKGALRERLQRLGFVEPGKPIPADILSRAAKGEFGPVTARRARLAQTLRKVNRK